MPSERVQRHIDRLLDEADQAADARDWATVRERVAEVLTLDADNGDARALGALAERGLPTGHENREADGERASVGEGLVPSRPEPELEPSPNGTGEASALPATVATTQDQRPTAFVNGRYEVEKFLGEGGKKQVYLARDTLLDRRVAFALIKTEGLDQTGRDRITREAQAMGRLGAHPNIVTVFDIGTLPATGNEHPSTGSGRAGATSGEAGQPYIVTELMEGGDVEGVIEKAPERRPPLAQSLVIAVDICRGLEFAHAHGIVHRDLKPGNVWLTGSDQPSAISRRQGGAGPIPSLGTAKLGDFGLAVALDRSRLTQAGMMVGTVSYMPPEQAMDGAVTPRADLYSLGAMLYELVTGRPPFVGNESVAIITQHLNATPVAPSWHNAAVPPGLEALILHLLEKDPARRPAGAREVRDALESILASVRDPSFPAFLSQAEKRDGAPTPATLHPTPFDNPMYRRTFVGREPELRQLQSAYDAAASGQGSLVMVVGEPGIGKTSLCEQLATYAAIRGGRTLVGHCYEEGSLSLPYLPFVEAMQSYVLVREPAGLQADLGSGARDVARIVSEVRERLHVEPSAPAGDADEDRWRLSQAVAGFLRNAAAVQPLVIVLEDLHDADRGTLDLLVHLARQLAGSRLLLVGTYRDIEVDRAHPLSATLAELRRGSGFSRVQLRGLTADEVARMLSQLSGHDVPWRLAEAVHRETEGNPLFIQEVLRYLVEEGKLGSGRAGATGQDTNSEGASALGGLAPSPGAVAETPLEFAIPEGLRDVIGKRLSRLSPECNRVLAVAAVIGREFQLTALKAVAEVEEEPLLAALEEAARVGVLEDRSGRGQVRFRFTHAFFRQTLYEELFTPRRLRLHQQVARALEKQYAGRLEEHAAELAEHFAQSSDPDDLAKAVNYSEMAAQRALSVYAYGEAARHLEQAVQAQEVLDSGDKVKRCDLLLALGDALIPAGEPLRAAEEIAPQALKDAEAVYDRARSFRSCRLALEALLYWGGARAFAGRDGERWQELADRYAGTDKNAQAYADVALARIRARQNRARDSWEATHRALELARQTGNRQILFESVSQFMNAARVQDLDECLRIVEDVATGPREGISASSLMMALGLAAAVFLARGLRERADALWRELAGLEGRLRSRAWGTWGRGILLAAIDGDLEGAVALGSGALNGAEAAGMRVAGRNAVARASHRPLIYLGRAEEALASVAEDDVLAPSDMSSTWFADRLPRLAYSGRRDEAADHLGRWLTSHRTPEHIQDLVVSEIAAALEVAVIVGNRDAIAFLVERLTPVAHVGAMITQVSLPTTVARHLGDAAMLVGEQQQALALYKQALDLATRMRHRPEIALIHLGMAEAMLGATNGAADSVGRGLGEDPPGRIPRHPKPEASAPADSAPKTPATTESASPATSTRAEAMQHLDFAIAEFRAMKMQPSLERALRHKDVLKA